MKFFSKNKKNSLLKSFGFDADKDWKIVVIVAGVICLALLVWSGYLYSKVMFGGNQQETVLQERIELVKKRDLDQTLRRYEVRKEEFEKLKVIGPSIQDPSI